MSTMVNPFVSTNHDEFVWPHPLPMETRPSPPLKTAGRRLYMPRMDPDKCECDIHHIETSLNRYKELARQEKDLCKNIRRVNHQMTTLMSHMLENSPSSEDEIMKSVYQIGYDRNEECSITYRSMVAAVDSPIAPVIPQLESGYRDAMRFRCSPVEIPGTDTPDSVDYTREPETFSAWSRPFTGRSEYMDTISKLGRSNLINQQQYFEPLPSSRRRLGDCRQ